MSDGTEGSSKKAVQATKAKPAPASTKEVTVVAPEADPYKNFLEAFRTYNRALQDIWEDTQAQSQRINRQHLLEQRRVQAQAQESFEEAYRTYTRAQQDALAREDAQRLLLEVARDYQQALRDAQLAGQLSWEEAHRSYQQNLELGNADFQKRCDTAFRDYLRAIKAAWVETEVDSLDAELLSAVARNVMCAAQLAGRTL